MDSNMKTRVAVVVWSALLLFVVAGGHAAEAHGVESLVAPYEKIHVALVAEDVEAAKQAAAALAKSARAAETAPLEKSAGLLADSKDLAEARERFKTVSKDLMALVQDEKGYYLVSCPMAHAVWIQTDRAVKNPYLGKEMLSCGSLQATGPGRPPTGPGSVPASSTATSPSGGGGHHH